MRPAAGARRIRRALTVLVFCCALPRAAQAAPAAFSFLKTMNLRQGQTFSIWIRTPGLFGAGLSRVGEGRIKKLTERALHFDFSARILTRALQGDVALEYGGRTKNEILLKLTYSGSENGRPERSQETVRLDAFLAGGGIVSFHYHQNRRFLQISRSSSGENKFVTDWGAATLIHEGDLRGPPKL